MTENLNDYDGGISAFFYDSLPDRVGMFKKAAQRPAAPTTAPAIPDSAAVEELKKNQDHRLDVLNTRLPDMPDTNLVRKLVNVPDVRCLLVAGYAARFFGEHLHPRPLSYMMAAAVLNGSLNREEITHEFSTQTKKILSDLIILNAADNPETAYGMPFDKMHMDARRLYAAGLIADMTLAYNEITQKTLSAKIKDTFDMPRIAAHLVRHAEKNGPIIDRGDKAMTTHAVALFNKLSEEMGYTLHLYFGTDNKVTTQRPGNNLTSAPGTPSA